MQRPDMSMGGVEKLDLCDLAVPEVGPGQVRVAVKACALNHLDIWVRQGWPALRISYPHILGSDVAGVVDGVGPGVSGIDEEAEVILAPGVSCGRCEACLSGLDNRCPGYGILDENVDGGYAEHMVVPAANVFPKPAGISHRPRHTERRFRTAAHHRRGHAS